LPLSFRIPHSTFRSMTTWFNAVDATYRGDLRELNEHNFARFDAKLEQRLTQLDAKMEQRAARLDAKLEQELTEVRADFAGLAAKLEQRLAEVRADLRDELQAQGRRLLLWMVGLWITAVAALYFMPGTRP
jgi:DNA anti-recombination protein RmuC